MDTATTTSPAVNPPVVASPAATAASPDARVVADRFAALGSAADEAAANALSVNTRRSYLSDVNRWVDWCHHHQTEPFPVDPDLLRLYVTALALTGALKTVSISRAVSAISYANHRAGFEGRLGHHPRVAPVLRGVRRARQEPRQPRDPLLRDDVTALVTAMDHTTWPAGVLAARDTFAFWLGFAAAMRRSEVAALRVGDVTGHRLDGIHIRVTRSKADQGGAGALLAVPYGRNPVTCAPCAWVRWTRLLDASRREGRPAMMRLILGTGHPDQWTHVCGDPAPLPLFDTPDAALFPRCGRHGLISDRPVDGGALNAAVQRRVAAAGLNPHANYGFHSLRAGFVTQARRNQASAREVRRQTRHGSDVMVDVYDRDHDPLRDNAVTRLGL